MRLARRLIVVADLDPTVGHEHRGVRPCVVVSDPDVATSQRFPVICVVPLTGTPGEGLLYPAVAHGKSGLTKRSFALVAHLRSIDKRRIVRVFGEVSQEEIMAIDQGLVAFLGLAALLSGSASLLVH